MIYISVVVVQREHVCVYVNARARSLVMVLVDVAKHIMPVGGGIGGAQQRRDEVVVERMVRQPVVVELVLQIHVDGWSVADDLPVWWLWQQWHRERRSWIQRRLLEEWRCGSGRAEIDDCR